MRKAKTKFVICGQGRSGSTLLKQLLNSHPDITCEGELYNAEDGYFKHPLMIRLLNKFPFFFFNFRSWKSSGSVYGFTLLYYQYEFRKDILENLKKKGWKFIHLTRRDYISQSLSHLVAEQTAIWHRRDDKTEIPGPITINPEKFLHWTKQLFKNKAIENKLFEGKEHLEIVYEDDLAIEDKWPETTSRIFNYLGVTPKPVEAVLKKTYPRPYSEIVENYDELLQLLNGS